MKPGDLITWRKERNLTQAEFAVMLGVTNVCISRWESGKRKIPAFLHITLKCLKVKKGGEHKRGVKGKKTKKEKGR